MDNRPSLDLTPILEVSEDPPVIIGHYSFIKELRVEDKRNLMLIDNISFDTLYVGDNATLKII